MHWNALRCFEKPWEKPSFPARASAKVFFLMYEALRRALGDLGLKRAESDFGVFYSHNTSGTSTFSPKENCNENGYCKYKNFTTILQKQEWFL
jgi:hypothetical protein